jgi:circadian clock protein KaiC
VTVLDGVASFTHGASAADLTSMMSRQLDLLKAREITIMATTLGHGDETSSLGVSSLVDVWLLLRNVETNAERNRLLFVLKSRGTAHSNQVREFLLTDHGVELVDVSVGPSGVLTGSARLAQEAAEREAEERRVDQVGSRRREVSRAISEREAQLAVLQDELDSERAELGLIDVREHRQAAETQSDQLAMATQRWADTPKSDGGGR